MAGTWMSIVEGFGGMRVRNDALHFSPKIPKEWTEYSFKINFRNNLLRVSVSHLETTFSMQGNNTLTVFVNGKEVVVESTEILTI